jgi:hypothetical protein
MYFSLSEKGREKLADICKFDMKLPELLEEIVSQSM